MFTEVSMRERQSDPERLELARAGDRDAFDGLIREHFRAIYSLLFRAVGNHEDAEDLAQECFVRAWSSLHFYRGDTPFLGWLRRIATHLARDHHRRRGRRGVPQGLDDSVEPSGGSSEPVEALGQRELVAGLGRAIERLPDSLRSALVLRVLEGLEYRDVADAAGVNEGTARTQVMKARRMLMRWLRPWLGTHREGGPA